MYKVNQEFLFNDVLYKENDKIENPTRRMIELGIVSFYHEQIEKTEQIEKIEESEDIKTELNKEAKPKRNKKKKTEKIENIEQTEQILTEISDEVVVEIQTDDSE